MLQPGDRLNCRFGGRTHWRCVVAASISMVGLICGGCGGSTGTVGGKVTLDGQPVGQGMVLFHAAADSGNSTVAGTIQPDGSYEVKAAGDSDDIPIGKYEVTVHPGDGTESEEVANTKIPGRYADPATSGLAAEVVSSNNSFNFDLKTKEAQ